MTLARHRWTAGTAAVLVAAVTLVVVAGCGSSGGAAEGLSQADQDAASREKVIAEGDDICAQGQVEAAELRRRAAELQAQRGTVSEEELFDLASTLWDDQIELIERYRDRFNELDPPPGDETRIDAIVQSFDNGLDVAREIKQAIEDGDEPPADLLQRYSRIVAQGNALALAYGFKVCGRTA